MKLMMVGGGKTEISAGEVTDSEACKLGPAKHFGKRTKLTGVHGNYIQISKGHRS